jgi:hypothetical protein
MSPQHRRARRGTRSARVVRIVITCVAVASVALCVRSGATATVSDVRQTSVSSWTVADRQQACLARLIETRLPRGTPVYIGSSQGFASQELIELSTLWVVPQPTTASATWVLSLVPGEDCSGETVRLRHP